MANMSTNEKAEKREAHNAWAATLPDEYDGLFLSIVESGYVDEYGNMIVHLNYSHIGKDIAEIFAEVEEDF
jgi:hypothetical protein